MTSPNSALSPLPPAPARAFDEQYHAVAGRFQGQLHEVRWGYYRGWLHGQVRRALVRKRWFQLVIHADATTFVLRIQDDGVEGWARAFTLGGQPLDLAGKGAPLRTMVTGFMAGEGTDAFWRHGQDSVTLTRAPGHSAWLLKAHWQGLALDLTLDSAGALAPTLTVGAHAPPYAHRPGLTQRDAHLQVTGTASLHGQPLLLAGGLAELAYANAFLAPLTEASLISALGGDSTGARVALHLSDGDLHGGTPEATLVTDAGAFALPEAHCQWGPDGSAHWQANGLDLHFQPEASHSAKRGKGPLRAPQALAWGAGTLTGRLPGLDAPVTLRALAERHRWGPGR